MLSFLFLASVANANNAFSASNEFMTATQRITARLQAEMYMPVQSGRRLADLKPCRWSVDKECEMTPQFALSTDEAANKPDLKAYGEAAVKCEANKKEADCGKDATCEFKSSKCTLSGQESQKYLMKILKVDSKCGAFVKAAMSQTQPKDACNKNAKADCANTCEWHASFDYDKDTSKCVDTSECATKRVNDPKDPFGLKQACPDMTATQKDTCDKKSRL